MGRPRKLEQGLPKRVYLKSGAYYYVHHDSRWERLGTDLAAAKKTAAAYNAGACVYGTMAYWYDQWALELKARVAAADLSERTYDDYVEKDGPLLKDFFGAMAPGAIKAKHVSLYLQVGREDERPVRANREKAALSSCLSWMVAHSLAGLKGNVCKGVPRNSETPRDRYISDDEYIAVMKRCGPAEKAWAELIYRTLQRPSDILKWTRNDIIIQNGQKCIQFRQGKTKSWMTILVTPTLEAAFEILAAQRKRPSVYLIPREDGLPYTESGIASMFRRAVVAAGIADYGPYDNKAKGATDMYEAGVPIETICVLCGHESVKTTEIYIKRRSRKTVAPNDRIVQPSMPIVAPG